MTDNEIYEYLGQAFEWNRAKAAKNVLRHGVRFTEAATVFFDPERSMSGQTRAMPLRRSGTLQSGIH